MAAGAGIGIVRARLQMAWSLGILASLVGMGVFIVLVTPRSTAKTVQILEHAPGTRRTGLRRRGLGLFTLVFVPFNLVFQAARPGSPVREIAAPAVYGPGCHAPDASDLLVLRRALAVGARLDGAAVVGAGATRAVAARVTVAPTVAGFRGETSDVVLLLHPSGRQRPLIVADPSIDAVVYRSPSTGALSRGVAFTYDDWSGPFRDPEPVARACSVRWRDQPAHAVQL